MEVPTNETDVERLVEGELGPWREWLVKYYLEPNEENRRRVFDFVRDQQTFERSVLSKGAQRFKVFRCEALFYDALLQSVSGDKSTRDARYRAGLGAVVAEDCTPSFEFDMARWFLARPAGATH